MPSILVHRFAATTAGTPVNAYVLRGPARQRRGRRHAHRVRRPGPARHARLARRPLLGVVLTHAHPDHYGGLAELVRGLDVPVVATRGVAEAIVRDDPVKETILRPMFGDEWAARRAFPNRIAADGEVVDARRDRPAGDDLGPGESPHDSLWSLVGQPGTVFSGDVAYDRRHCYLADGRYEGWLSNIAPRGASSRPARRCIRATASRAGSRRSTGRRATSPRS